MLFRSDVLNTSTTFTVSGFDPLSLSSNPPSGARVYVANVTVNGVQRGSVCWLGFGDVVGGGEVVLGVDADAEAAARRGCGGVGGMPDSLGTGGFSG